MTAYLSRPRLLQTLDTPVPLTYVYGMAGSGKTALLREWLRTQPRTAWLTASEIDSDPLCLWQRLCQTLGIMSATPLTGDVFPSSLEAAVLSGVQGLTEQPPVALVIDDYHLMCSAESRWLIRCLLQMRPPSLRLIIASQTRDESLPLSRWCLSEEAIEIGPTELAFTPDEIQSLTASSSSQMDCDALYKATHGWVAGVLLLLKQEISVQALENLLSQSLASRLCQMVFETLNSQHQTFLIQASVLDLLTPGACEEIIEIADSHKTLEELASQGFLNAIDETHHSFHLSNLWSAFLRPLNTNASQLHRSAALHYQHTGDIYRAITHAIQGDHTLAAQLLCLYGGEFLARGELITLRTWLDQLPDTCISVDARLSCLMAWVLVHQGALDQAERYLHHPEQTPREILPIRARIAALRGDKRGMIAFSEQALSHIPHEDFAARADVLLNLGCAYLEIGQIAQAQPLMIDALRLSRAAGHARAEVFAHYFLGKISVARGRLQQAQHYYQEGLAAHSSLSVLGVLHAALGEIYYERNDLVTARTHLDRALQMGEQGGEIKPIAYAQIAFGALVSPQEAVQRLESLTRLTNWALLYAWQAVWWLRAGNVSMASYWLEDMQAADWYLSEFERMVQARVLIALQEWRQAETLLNELAQAAREHQRWGDLIRILLLQARLAYAQGQPQASSYMLEALKRGRVGEMDGYLRTFMNEGEPILSLCSALGYAFGEANGKGEWREGSLPFGETLSPREMEVLSLIAEGASNEEIAQRLFLTVGTVKWHVHNVFGKLDVKNRTQAVKKAQILRLILA